MACFYYDVYIDAADLSLSDDGRVYFDYYDCSTGLPATTDFTSAGTQNNAICNNDSSGLVTYYILVSGLPTLPPNGSNATGTLNTCGIPPSPSATSTSTPTPTVTPTPGIAIYAVSNYTTSSAVSPVCPGYYDITADYEFTLYDENGSQTTLPFNVVVDLTGTTTPYGLPTSNYSTSVTINSGSTTGFTSFLISENLNCPCPCVTTWDITYTAVTTTEAGYKFFASAAAPGPLPPAASPTPTSTPSQTGTAPVTPTPSPTGDNCVCFEVVNDVGPGSNSFTYLDCNYNPQAIIDYPPGPVTYVCAILGSETAIGLSYIQVDESFCGGCIESITPTPTSTETLTPTPTQTPTTTPPCFPHVLYTGITCPDACLMTGSTVTVYTSGATINIGDHFYLDCALTIDADMNLYSDGTDCYDYTYSSNGANTAYVGDISSCSLTPTPTSTPTQTPTTTETPTPSTTTTLTATATETQTPTQTQTSTPTNTETPTPSTTTTLTATATETQTPTPTPTNTQTPSSTETPTQTPTPTNTQTPSSTETPTQTPSETPTTTPTQTSTSTVTPSPTPTGDNCVCFELNDDVGPGPNSFSYLDCNYVPQIINNIAGLTYVCAIIGSESGSNLSYVQVNESFCGGCIEGITPTPTETPSQTPTQTPTQTPSETSTQTPTQTPSETSTQTPTSTPTQTPSETPPITPSGTPTQTPTPTSTETPTQTPTQTSTPTSTPPSTPGYIVQFQDCTNASNIFRFVNVGTTLSLGAVYLISGSDDFAGCAEVVASTNTGSIYDGTGVTFTGTVGCGDPACPRASTRAALLRKCSDSTVHYFSVEEDTAFPDAGYYYNGECYVFVEFSGPGGVDLGAPDFVGCSGCNATPTPTPTQTVTASPTPTVSSTPNACAYSVFCLSTTFPSLSGYSGNFYSAGTYNSRIYYSGDGTTTGYIYWNTTYQGYWCLSDSLGGTCYLQGSSPCYSPCPDLAYDVWTNGLCPTPTPTGINCAPFNFLAYFDCDWEPLPTPTPSIPCDDLDFTYYTFDLTPTPTPTNNCGNNAVSFSLSAYTPAVTPTVTLTPTITLTRTVPVDGAVTFEILDETFVCSSAKVLIDCSTGEEIYTSDALVLGETPIVVGVTILAIADGVYRCLYYDRDDDNVSSNTNIDSIISITTCSTCSTIPTPTPSTTTTPTPTTTPSQSTPTPTQTQTQTPSQTSTVGTTPPVTPTQTATPTASNTPTPSITASPSATPNYVYVYQSCYVISQGSPYVTQIVQTQKVSGINVEGTIFKDNTGVCWSYVGRFETSYIAPPTVIPITWTGNYFGSINSSTTYPDCEQCSTITNPGCVTIYFNATRCDNGASVVVSACDLGESPLLTLTPFVGQTHGIINPSGDDFCVTLNSLTTAQPQTYQIGTAAYTNYTCPTCPIYKTYYANACDGSAQNILIYASSTSTTLNVGQAVTLDTSSVCYTIVSYEGIVIEQNVVQGITPQIQTSYLDCPECINSQLGGGFGGLGGGGNLS